MNLKQIDAAIAAYQPQLEKGDAVRLSFFRKLWGVQDAFAQRVKDTCLWEAPDVDHVRALQREECPLFSVTPVQVDSALFAEMLEQMVSCLVEHGGFPQEMSKALMLVKWDRIIQASNLEQAGSDPAAYLDTFAGLLIDDGLDERTAHTGVLAVAVTLRGMLEPAAAKATAALAQQTDYASIHCPVCGGAASAARVGGSDSTDGSGKTLWCAQCGATWEFERVRCARCGTRNQRHLHYYNLEGDEAHRLATCDECGGFVRTVYQEDALAPFAFEVEDVMMTKLDLLAYRQAFANVKEQASDTNAPAARGTNAQNR